MSNEPLSRKFDYHSLPRAYGQVVTSAVYKYCPDDFIVEEIAAVEPSGAGEHLYLQVRKRNQNTVWIAGHLARIAGVAEQDIGYAGLKDRNALTTQWFSIYLGNRDISPSAFVHDDFEVLQVSRHNRKLRRGMHNGNRFRIRLRNVAANREALETRLTLIRDSGVPNYFAEQRFGHGANNLYQAQTLIARKRLKGNRHKTGIYLSAARSWLFNLVLAERIERGIWDLQLPCEGLPAGPLWGRGRSPAVSSVAALETEVLSDWEDWRHALEHAGLSQERRPLVLVPNPISWQIAGDNSLDLQFTLPPGCYATAVLREFAELTCPVVEAL